MPVNLIPYGLLSDGKYGIKLDDNTRKPIAAAIEILTILPPIGDTSNFPGRTVFLNGTSEIYIFTDTPSLKWIQIDGGAVEIRAVAGNPPLIPVPDNGEFLFDTDTDVLFLYDGAEWVKVGGKYASSIVTQNYIGNGSTTLYPMGTNTNINPNYVEVFLDGVRQTPFVDYTVIGNQVSMLTAAPTGVIVLIRAMESTSVVQSAQVQETTSIATSGQTTFSLGVAEADPNGVLVFVNGIFKTRNVDYNLVQYNTQIISFNKILPTVAQIVTTNPHNLSINTVIRVRGGQSPEYNDDLFTVLNVINSVTFDVTVPLTHPVSAIPSPLMYFTPNFTNDNVVFLTPLNASDVVTIKRFNSITTAASGGEANNIVSMGGQTPLYIGKVGTDLQMKTVKSGPNVTINDFGAYIEISANLSQGFINRVGINNNVHMVTTEDYVGVRNTITPVTINLTGVPNNVSQSGRKIIIKDESGTASFGNITIHAGTQTIDGISNVYVINTNYGSVELVKDGYNWYTI